jgi:tetratricopeptide (TPR) repeat protein
LTSPQTGGAPDSEPPNVCPKTGNINEASTAFLRILDNSHATPEPALPQPTPALTFFRELFPFWLNADALENLGIEDSKDIVFEAIALAAAEKGFRDVALRVVNRIGLGFVKNRAIRKIVEKPLGSGRLEGALDLCRLLTDSDARGELFSQIAFVAASLGDKDAAKQAIDGAVGSGCELFGYGLAEFLWQVSVAQAKIGDAPAALGMAQKIEWLPVRVSALCQVALALFAEGKTVESTRVLGQALKDAKDKLASQSQQPVITNLGFLSDYHAFQLIAQTQAQLGNYTAAVETAQCVEWNPQHVLHLSEVLENGLVKGKDYLLCRVCAENAYLEEFHNALIRQEILGKIAAVQAHSGQLASAMEVAQLIEWVPIRVRALTEIAKAHSNAGNVSLARKTLASAATAALESRQSGVAPFLSEVVLAQAEVGDFEAATLNAARVCDVSVRAMLLAAVGGLQSKRCGWETAAETFQAAYKAALCIESVCRRVDVLVKLACEEAVAGAAAEATAAFKAVLALACSETQPFSKVNYLTAIASAQAKAGLKQQALETFALAADAATECSIESLAGVAVAQAKAGFAEEALATAQKLAATGKGGRAFEDLAEVFVDLQQPEMFKKALALFSAEQVLEGKTLVFLARLCPAEAEAIADLFDSYNVKKQEVVS